MKRTILTIFVLTFCVLIGKAQSVNVFIDDDKGDTNVRNAPKGVVVAKLPQGGDWMFNVDSPKNGWWRIVGGTYYGPDTDELQLKGSATGYWVHYSVICVGTRNYGGERLSLRKEPSAKSAAVFSFTDELSLRPLDVKGEWVKVTDGKHTGWIESEWLCGNAVSNCC